MCPFDYTAVAGSGKVGPVNQVNHTSWMAVVTPTDRPKSVRNRCVIELFCAVVCVVTLPFWHFCWCRGFCHKTELDLFLFLFGYLVMVLFWICQIFLIGAVYIPPESSKYSKIQRKIYVIVNRWNDEKQNIFIESFVNRMHEINDITDKLLSIERNVVDSSFIDTVTDEMCNIFT